jgi:regulator of extracellular matrix RemA (YlzA/DUF370 family)
MRGYLVGYAGGTGELFSRLVASTKEDDPCRPLISDQYKDADAYRRNVTVTQVRNGVTDFYKDYRNRSIDIVDAVDVVLHSIKGEDVENRILLYRRMSDKRQHDER